MIERKRKKVIVEIKSRKIRSRVGRKIEDKRNRIRNGVFKEEIKSRDEIIVRIGMKRENEKERNDEEKGVDRIGRVREKKKIERRGDGMRNIGEELIGEKSGEKMSVRVKIKKKKE